MLFLLVLAASVNCQTKFDKGVNTRLGLLGTTLGKDTLGRQQNGVQTNAALTQGQAPTGRAPAPEFQGEGTYTNTRGQQCCCVPNSNSCGDGLGRDDLDLVGTGLIDPRLKKPLGGITTRIVNRPGAEPDTNDKFNTCPVGQKACCYDEDIDLSVFGRSSCIQPGPRVERWEQGCSERVGPNSGVKLCGTREYTRPVSGLAHGTASPGEFPWTCLILNQNNDFVGSCALIPDNSGNDNRQGTRKVITAAHKLKDVRSPSELKVRIGEWDASGFNDPEKFNHQEYSVTNFINHPAYNPRRLSNDVALLTLSSFVDLSSPYVNTACLPSCNNQFDFTFTNGTGTRCWVAGWGKDEFDGSFQFLQRKVDLPLVSSFSCDPKLKQALNNQRSGSGNRFSLDSSEICAGGVEGKDACTGDGGSPLVCQASSGRWTVVGLVTWGVGCASDIPGVYARVSHFTSWIDQN